MTCSEAQKRASYKWIEKNREEWNGICRNNYKIYYDRNVEKVKQRKMELYYVKRELEIFRKILL